MRKNPLNNHFSFPAEHFSKIIISRWDMYLSIEHFAFFKTVRMHHIAEDFETPLLAASKNAWENRQRQKEMETNPRIVAWMEFKKEQFFLRDLLRIERIPDEPLEFSIKEIVDADYESDLEAINRLKYERPQFLTHFSVEDFKWLSSMLKEIIFMNKWNRFFCRELKENVPVPLWKYNPDT
jgi:hypothetical protein